MARSLDSGKAVTWRRRVGRFGRSGLTVVRFCKEEGVSTASFYRWRNKLADQTPAMRHADRTPAFQAVRVTSVHAPITIHLPGDVRMEVPTAPKAGSPSPQQGFNWHTRYDHAAGRERTRLKTARKAEKELRPNTVRHSICGAATSYSLGFAIVPIYPARKRNRQRTIGKAGPRSAFVTNWTMASFVPNRIGCVPFFPRLTKLLQGLQSFVGVRDEFVGDFVSYQGVEVPDKLDRIAKYLFRMVRLEL